MKSNYSFIIIVLLLFFCVSCKKKTTINTNNIDTKNTDTMSGIVEKFNNLPLKEKVKLYNKMIVDSQVSILNFFREKGMPVFLKKFVTKGDPWTKDIDQFVNIQEYNSAINDRPLFIGILPLYSISEQTHEATDAAIQYVNFFPAKNTSKIESDVRFITFYAWQENDIDALEIKSIDTSSFYIYFHFKNNKGATIQVQSNSALFQHVVENPFIFDSTLFPTINKAIEKMINAIP